MMVHPHKSVFDQLTSGRFFIYQHLQKEFIVIYEGKRKSQNDTKECREADYFGY